MSPDDKQAIALALQVLAKTAGMAAREAKNEEEQFMIINAASEALSIIQVKCGITFEDCNEAFTKMYKKQ
jgi:hypothetical protein